MLIQRREEKRGVSGLAAQRAGSLVAVDVIQRRIRVRREIRVQKMLERGDGQCKRRARDAQRKTAARTDEDERLLAGQGFAAEERCAAAGEERFKGGEQRRCIDMEERAVDGMKAQGAVVQVDELYQRVPRRMTGPLRRRQRVAQVQPALPRGGQRVIPVAHGVQKTAAMLSLIHI